MLSYMQSEVLVSFIIPCLNGEKYISTCLNSIISQTVPLWEAFVVDNGSDDDSIKVLQKFAKKDERIHILTSKIKCQSTAKNLAIKHAKGKYLCFVDIDDFISTNFIESYPICENFDFYFSNWTKIKDGKQTIRKFPINENFLDKRNIIDIQRWVIGDVRSKNPLDLDLFSSNCGKLYKTSIVMKNDISFIPMSFIGGSEDAIFNIQYLEFANNGFFSEKCLYNYISHDDSYTHSRSFEQLLLCFAQYDAIEDLLINLKKYEVWHVHLDRRLMIVSMSMFIIVSRLKIKYEEKINFLTGFLNNKIILDHISNMNPCDFGFPYKILFKLILKRKIRIAYFLVRVAVLVL